MELGICFSIAVIPNCHKMNGLTTTLIYYPVVSVGQSSDPLDWAAIKVLVGCGPFLGFWGESVFSFTRAVGRVKFHAIVGLGSCFLANCQLEIILSF